MKFFKLLNCALLLIFGFFCAQYEFILPTHVLMRYVEFSGSRGCIGSVVKKKDTYRDGISIIYKNVKFISELPFTWKVFKGIEKKIDDSRYEWVVDPSEEVVLNIQNRPSIDGQVIHVFPVNKSVDARLYNVFISINVGFFKYVFFFSDNWEGENLLNVLDSGVSILKEKTRLAKAYYVISFLAPLFMYFFCVYIFKFFKRKSNNFALDRKLI